MKVPREAIWLILLASVLLLLISKMHGETPRRIHTAKRYEKQLRARWVRLYEIQYLRPGPSLTGNDWMYITRADWDIELCRQVLLRYRHGEGKDADLAQAMKQLDRDMEDYPPTESTLH